MDNIADKDLNYLKLLAKQYPSIQAASTEIINLSAILNLPKGTEHFLTDIHGEYEAFLHVLKNGSVMPVEINARVIDLDGEEYIFSVIRDITEHKNRESQLHFQTKIYTALFYTNQALLNCKTEKSLFEKICQIAVDFGGMAMAWIGRADELSGQIKIEARCGDGQSYLDGLDDVTA